MPELTDRHRRALEMLAASPSGCSMAAVLARGFSSALVAELVEAGLATKGAERMIAGVRARITDAGRAALAGRS
jgi:hypothetical protein